MFELRDAWDFHPDLRLVCSDRADRAKYAQQLDAATAQRMGGIVSATGRLVRAAHDTHWAQLEWDAGVVANLPGLTLVRCAADLAGGGRQVLHAEGVYFIEREADLDDLARMWDLGFRSVAPLYNEDNALGGGARGDATRGLTALGRVFLDRAWSIGLLVDIAHCNHRTQADIIDAALSAGRPVNFTHGHLDEPALELFGERGLPRGQAERLARTGGLIGLSPHPGFVGYFRRFLDEVEFLSRACPKNAVLGSDFSGITTPPVTFPQFAGAARIPEFATLLAERCGEEFARDFCGRTLRSFLERTLPA